MIPKIIHQIWIGSLGFNEEWTKSWQEKNPSMKYMFWGEEEIEAFGLRFKDKVDSLVSLKYFSGATDIIRIELLDRFGGVYVDVDSYCLKPIEDAPFMDGEFFVGRDYDDRRGRFKDRVANGTIGSTKGHPVLKEYLEGIDKTDIKKWMTMGGEMLTNCIKGKDVIVLPTCTFYPKNWDKRKAVFESEIYAKHFWGTTTGKYN